jgi:hypothetical protein
MTISIEDRARLLSVVAAAQEKWADAQEHRRQAIVEAVKGGVSLRDVSSTAQCSYESVRRFVAADGVVALELDGTSYPLTAQEAEVLIYKLDGMAKGAFPQDLRMLAAGADWLPAAGQLASDLGVARSDDEGKPVVIDEAKGFALFQILRLTYFGGLSVFAQIFEVLLQRNGQPHVIAELSRNRPR